jgi:hypothetical protein
MQEKIQQIAHVTIANKKIMLGSLITPAILIATPLVSFAHEEHTLMEETLLFLGNSISAILGVALMIGIVVGMAVFAFQRNKKEALLFGSALSICTALILIALFGIPSARQNPIASSEQQLAGAMATVYKSPTCGCCGGYVEELKRQGATVDVKVVSDTELAKIKVEQGVSSELYSCHTSIIDGYVVEGHVPIEAVAKLRTERPDIKGIALPGMPSGTPGMPGPKFAPYDVRTIDGNPYLEI